MTARTTPHPPRSRLATGTAFPVTREARTASTAAYCALGASSSTRWIPIIISYAHGHSFGASATERPIANDWPIPINAASRTAVPVRSSTGSSVSTTRTIQPNGVKFGNTRCSTSQLYGESTGWSTARCVQNQRPVRRFSPKSGGNFHHTWANHSKPARIRRTARPIPLALAGGGVGDNMRLSALPGLAAVTRAVSSSVWPQWEVCALTQSSVTRRVPVAFHGRCRLPLDVGNEPAVQGNERAPMAQRGLDELGHAGGLGRQIRVDVQSGVA